MTSYLYRQLTPNVLESNKHIPAVVITGPLQSGKTTLCRHLFPDYGYADLDDISTRLAAMENPVGFLDSLGDKAIIEEIIYVPELTAVIADRIAESPDHRYIITGRSQFSVSEAAMRSFSGVSARFNLLPLSIVEAEYLVEARSIDEIIVGGLFPRVIGGDSSPERFYRNYYSTYIERDLRDHISSKNLLAFDKFMRLLAMRVSMEFNASALAREVGVSSVTIKEWFGILAESYIAFPLTPYHDGKSRPQTKMPKIYFYDTGFASFLLGIDSAEKLQMHPMRGPLFENLAINELFKNKCNRGNAAGVYFYRDRSGAEVDAVVQEGGGLRLYEITPGHTIRRGYSDRMKKTQACLAGVISSATIYEGESILPVALNIRDI